MGLSKLSASRAINARYGVFKAKKEAEEEVLGMVFASKAQIAKFKELRKAGKVSLETIAHKSRGTDLKNLPERVQKKV